MSYRVIEQDINGNGVVKDGNIPIFVNKALTAELIDIKIDLEKKNYKRARITKILEKSDDRVNPKCKYYDICGGCDLLHQSYDSQLQFKKDKVKKNLKKISNIEVGDLKINYGDQFNYRNKLTLHSDSRKIGLYKTKSKEIIKIDKCLLVDEKINKKLKDIKPNSKDIIIRSSIDNVVVDNKINKKIGNYKFIVRRDSFFQVNDEVTKKLYDKIKESLVNSKESILLDLYCGSGTIGIYVADMVRKVTCIELNETSIKDAKENMNLNKIKNAEFILGDVAKEITKIKNADIVIIDPPRKGLDKNTINQILDIKPETIIYVSCDSATLARDLKELKEKYNIKEIELFDMFPNTKHVETLVKLEVK